MFEFFSEKHILVFLLILLRISGFIIAWPVFNMIPLALKVFFPLILTVLLFPVVNKELLIQDFKIIHMIWWSGKELLIGLSMGFLSRFFFFVFHVVGHLVGLNIGILSAELFDPSHGERMNVIQQFHVLLASLFFLFINGHLLLLDGLAKSFEIIPIAKAFFSFKIFGEFGFFFQELMELGLKISAPILVTILFSNVSISILGRVVPQMNVLINSLPLNILIGFFLLGLLVPILFWKMEDVFEITTTRMFQILKAY